MTKSQNLDRQMLRIVDSSSQSRAAEHGPEVLDRGPAIFDDIIRRIDLCRTSLEMRIFLWRDDETGNRLGQAVLRAADRGVKVHVYKDRIAAVYEYSGGNKQSFLHKRLNPAEWFQAQFLATVYKLPGSSRQRANPLSLAILSHPNITVHHQRKRFDHAKLFIFDEESMIICSMGIADSHHYRWYELGVALEGHRHVDRLRQRLNGHDRFEKSREIDFILHSREVHPVKTCPMVDDRIELIDSAEHSIMVEMAYLGDTRFTAALARAVKRGVETTLITAARADVLENLNLATCDMLLRATGAPRNLRICLLPRMVHSKAVLVDERYADIGSANFTRLSHGVYDETNIWINDLDFAAQLKSAFESHMDEGYTVDRRVRYRRLHSRMERVFVAFQSRKGG